MCTLGLFLWVFKIVYHSRSYLESSLEAKETFPDHGVVKVCLMNSMQSKDAHKINLVINRPCSKALQYYSS